MPGHGRHVDNVSALLLGHVRQRGGDAVENAFDVHINHALPVFDLAALQRRMRHQTCVVDNDIDPAMKLDGPAD
jgi:hypothetical protein